CPVPSRVLGPLRAPLFPYTTLFRSRHGAREAHAVARRSLPHLAHLGLAEERHVARDLPRREDRQGDAIKEIDPRIAMRMPRRRRSEEHTSELQSQSNLVCRLLLEKK